MESAPAPGSPRRPHVGALALLVGLALLSGAGALSPSAAAGRLSTDTYEQQVQQQVNRVRTAHDLPRLRLAGCTDAASESWSGHLAASGEFYHQSMPRLLHRCDAVYAGETLGRGGMTPRRLVRLWMSSPGHRAVLLNGTSRRIGVGARIDSSGRWVVAANFMRF